MLEITLVSSFRNLVTLKNLPNGPFGFQQSTWEIVGCARDRACAETPEMTNSTNGALAEQILFLGRKKAKLLAKKTTRASSKQKQPTVHPKTNCESLGVLFDLHEKKKAKSRCKKRVLFPEVPRRGTWRTDFQGIIFCWCLGRLFFNLCKMSDSSK